MGSLTSMVSRKYPTITNFVQSRVSIYFSCTISEIQNSSHSQCIHGKSYEHGFTKKDDCDKHCAKSHAKSSFNWFLVLRLRNSKY
ncbi:hypothetical protein BHE74_00031042 [Ensete ventricosum]|nr:hypothetical protein BHE74_00031042 [Ensete ventricosum]